MTLLGATRLLLLALSASQALAQAPFLYTCGEDAQIDDGRKKAIDESAIKFTDAILGPDSSVAFGLLSKKAQADTTAEQFKGVDELLRRFEPKNIKVQHTYFVDVKGGSPSRAVCGTSFSKPDGWESLQVEDVPEQAYVLLSADTGNNRLAITLWLVPENGWKINDFRVTPSSLGDLDSLQLLEEARLQHLAGHSFNAALLYAAAAQTADRGPSFQLGITQSISNEMSKLAIPDDVRGQPPFLWRDGETTYKVMNVGPIAIGGKIYVAITHEVSPWQSDQQVDGWNKALIVYFKHRFPEYSDVFAGLVVRAKERGTNRGFGTVDELSSQKKKDSSH